MNVSDALKLLDRAERGQDSDWLLASLLTAAAIRSATGDDMVVVGGTAQAFWTGVDVYNPTDLDLWFAGPMGADIAEALRSVGFSERGRHWERPGLDIVVEFPSGSFAGARDRIATVETGGGSVPVIGVDDLFIDRLAQSTANSRTTSIEFTSALALAAYRVDSIDWRYVRRRIDEISEGNAHLRRLLLERHREVRRAIRRPGLRAD